MKEVYIQHEKNEKKRINMEMEWEYERKIMVQQNEMLKQQIEEAENFKSKAKEKYTGFVEEKKEHLEQFEAQRLDKVKLIEDNKKAKREFLRNEEAMIEYQTLTFKQSQKIKELKKEMKELNEKFPEEVSKYTKELEFMKFDNESKKAELEFTYQSKG
jgi:hypothetical protein